MASRAFQSIRLDQKWTHINYGMGCPNGCVYCIQLKDIEYDPNNTDKRYSIDSLINQIDNHKYVSKRQPLVIGNATDPFLKPNLNDVKTLLTELDQRKYKNPVSIITKIYPDDKYLFGNKTLKTLRKLKHLKPSLLVSYVGYKNKSIEKVSGKKRVRLLKEAHDYGIPTILYYRPIVRAWMDDKDEPFHKKVERVAKETKKSIDAVVMSGLYFTEEIFQNTKKRNLPLPFDQPWSGKRQDNEKNIPEVVNIFKNINPKAALFTSTSCAVSYLYKMPNFVGYYGLRVLEKRDRECHNICAPKQRDTCRTKTPKVKNRLIKRALKEININAKFKNHPLLVRVFKEISMSDKYYLMQNLNKLVIDDGRYNNWSQGGIIKDNLEALKIK
ncbi:hypothetical protein K9M79_06035 [Candidatus Woesearchaeota archaeon]|nr:hypothetical protein [Candidatus Woesearchaeota archaeon]